MAMEMDGITSGKVGENGKKTMQNKPEAPLPLLPSWLLILPLVCQLLLLCCPPMSPHRPLTSTPFPSGHPSAVIRVTLKQRSCRFPAKNPEVYTQSSHMTQQFTPRNIPKRNENIPPQKLTQTSYPFCQHCHSWG